MSRVLNQQHGEADEGAQPSEPAICRGGRGLFFPVGGKFEEELDDGVRTVLYGVALLYLFQGVSIVADAFMSAIEAITSRKQRIRVKETGRYVTVQVWNDTVANLTLMALGSSAPEILLSVVEIFKEEFFSGELGPSTIVGSAAFNLLVIVAVCIVVIPSPEVRVIKEHSVYVVTALFSILAYIWLLVIVQVITPDVVDLWEALTLLLLLPLLVVLSWMCDAGYFSMPCLTPAAGANVVDVASKDGQGRDKDERTALEQSVARPDLQLGGDHDHACESDNRTLFHVVPHHISEAVPEESGSFGREEAPERQRLPSKTFHVPPAQPEEQARSSLRSSFRGSTVLQRRRLSFNNHLAATADFNSEVAYPSARSADEDVKEKPNYVRVSSFKGMDIVVAEDSSSSVNYKNGVLTFGGDTGEVLGGMDERQYAVPVHRRYGTEGHVTCNWHMERMTAIPGYDYVEDAGRLEFVDGQSQVEINFTVLPKQLNEHDDQFQIILDNVEGGAVFDPHDDGGEDSCVLTVTIKNELQEMRGMVSNVSHILDGMLNLDEARLGQVTWGEQISDAVWCWKEEEFTRTERVLVILSVPWRLLYAILCPPAVFCGGWVCFVCSLLHIGLLTAVIIDIAELFGCVAGIEDSITAMMFVALGTSMPDLFASRSAACQDEYADASIVNVTGSNSVNVFLGIGLPWTVAAIYWEVKGATPEWIQRYPDFHASHPQGAFIVKAGELGFSVAIFGCAAIVVLLILHARRHYVGGELGGPFATKVTSSFLMVSLWFWFLVLYVWKLKTSSSSPPVSEQVAIIVLSWVAIGAVSGVGYLAMSSLSPLLGECRMPEVSATVAAEGADELEHSPVVPMPPPTPIRAQPYAEPPLLEKVTVDCAVDTDEASRCFLTVHECPAPCPLPAASETSSACMEAEVFSDNEERAKLEDAKEVDNGGSAPVAGSAPELPGVIHTASMR